MALFCNTVDGIAFIATADSRETSPEIMQAIAFFAKDAEEANALWNGDGFGTVCHLHDVWEYATGNGHLSGADLYWGDRTLNAVVAAEPYVAFVPY